MRDTYFVDVRVAVKANTQGEAALEVERRLDKNQDRMDDPYQIRIISFAVSHAKGQK